MALWQTTDIWREKHEEKVEILAASGSAVLADRADPGHFGAVFEQYHFDKLSGKYHRGQAKQPYMRQCFL
jgi:hypothetical protein